MGRPGPGKVLQVFISRPDYLLLPEPPGNHSKAADPSGGGSADLLPLGSAALRPKIEYGGGQAENTGAGTSWTTKNQGQRVSPPLSMGTQDHSPWDAATLPMWHLHAECDDLGLRLT